MKIKLKVSLSGADFSYYAGQEVNIDDKTAKEWIEADVAEVISTTKKEKSEPAKG